MFLGRYYIWKLVAYSIPVIIVFLGSIIAIESHDYIYLKKCVIAGYFFIPLFVWRLCVFFYYKDRHYGNE